MLRRRPGSTASLRMLVCVIYFLQPLVSPSHGGQSWLLFTCAQMVLPTFDLTRADPSWRALAGHDHGKLPLSASAPNLRSSLTRMCGRNVITCATIKEDILKRRQSVDKDLKYLHRFDTCDKGHAKELDQKLTALEKALKRWDDRDCPDDDDDDPEVSGIQNEVKKARQAIKDKGVVKFEKVTLSYAEIALKLGVSVLLVCLLVELAPLALVSMLGSVGVQVGRLLQ
eukprot:UN3076